MDILLTVKSKEVKGFKRTVTNAEYFVKNFCHSYLRRTVICIKKKKKNLYNQDLVALRKIKLNTPVITTYKYKVRPYSTSSGKIAV